MSKELNFDILIIGGGHAGVEACAIASRYPLKVGLITLEDVPIASAPCNPCVGGVGKGQVVREIDALGGIMGILADKAGIQYRTLNESKGYAVHSTRVQIDKNLYPIEASKMLSSFHNLEIIKGKVCDISRLGHERDSGYLVKLENSEWSYGTKKIILTVGTFLGGKLHMGSEKRLGGRMDAASSSSMMDLFSNIKLLGTRFKTGTPARIFKSSIDFTKAEEQASDDLTFNFHWKHLSKKRFCEQVSCFLTRTNAGTSKIIEVNKEKSPMYNGQIKAIGARYCPSIEDKVHRYPEKTTHHVFLEPESLDGETIYPSGISSSLPKEIQAEFIKTIDGLENAKVKSYGYAVEYDVVDTTELNYGLEHKELPGLYFAGQVNGTSGYEEAAGQGFIAGINAVFSLQGKELFKLDRFDSYIGVMIEDLITSTRDEPYRLFTARSENRLYIREDNVFRRMKPYRDQLGLAEELDMFHVEHGRNCQYLFKFCDQTRIARNHELFNLDIFKAYKAYDNKIQISEILRWPEVDIEIALKTILEFFDLSFDRFTIKSIAVEIKYEGYIKRSEIEQNRVRKLDKLKIDWREICASDNISFECKQRIEKIKPETFGQLKQMEGIRQATLAAVAGYFV